MSNPVPVSEPVVAVIDSGVDPGIGRIVTGVDFTGSGDSRGWRDECGHGTSAAREILAVAPRASIVPVRVMDRYGALERPAYLDSAFDWIGEHCAAMGIGAVCAAFGDDSYSQSDEKWRGTPLRRTLARLRRQGVAVVCAAGNWYSLHRRRNPQGMAWPAILREMISAGELEETPEGPRLTSTTLRLHESYGTGCATTVFAESGAMKETSGSVAVVAGHLAALRIADPRASVDELVARLIGGCAVRDGGLDWPAFRPASVFQS